MKYFLLLLTLLPCAATAARFDVVSGVEFVITHNPAVFTANVDWISLAGVSTVGSCGTSTNPNGAQRVVFRIPDAMDKAFDVALAAQIDGFRLQVSVDDTIVDAGGYCILRWVTARSTTLYAPEKELPVVRQVE